METPVSEALTLLKSGMKSWEIANQLKEKGYNMQQISDAMNQANIKQGVEGNMPLQQPQMQESVMDQSQDFDIPLPGQEQQPVAQQQQYSMPAQPQMSYQDIQAVAEQIVEEKWKEMMRSVGEAHPVVS